MSKLKITVNKSLHNELKMDSLMKPQYSVISEISSVKGTPRHIRDWLMELQPDSHANHSQLQGNEKGRKTNEICGLSRLNAFALYDHNSHCWKTSQVSFLQGTCNKFLGTWPKQGMMLDGVCWERTMWVPHIEEKGCGLWATPNTMDALPPKSPQALMYEDVADSRCLVRPKGAEVKGGLPEESQNRRTCNQFIRSGQAWKDVAYSTEQRWDADPAERSIESRLGRMVNELANTMEFFKPIM